MKTSILIIIFLFLLIPNFSYSADYVLIINNDTLFSDKKLLMELMNIFEKHKNAGVVSPKIYFAPGYEFYEDRYTKKDKGKIISSREHRCI